MPFQMGWYIESRVVEARCSGEITLEEFHRANKQLAEFLQSGIPPLFLLVDVREVTKIPLDFKGMLTGVRQESAAQNVNFDWIIFLSNNNLLNFFSALASNIARISSRIVKTQEEADLFIARHTPDLAAELPAHSASRKLDNPHPQP